MMSSTVSSTKRDPDASERVIVGPWVVRKYLDELEVKRAAVAHPIVRSATNMPPLVLPGFLKKDQTRVTRRDKRYQPARLASKGKVDSSIHRQSDGSIKQTRFAAYTKPSGLKNLDTTGNPRDRAGGGAIGVSTDGPNCITLDPDLRGSSSRQGQNDRTNQD